MNRLAAALVAASLLAGSMPARADNPMGYRLLSPEEASGLPHNHGALGLDVESSQLITDAGMTFDIIRIKGTRSGSAGAAAGLRRGDQIISLDGRVFPNLSTFAAYVGALKPGMRTSIDYIPSGGGPAQAQRVAVTIGGGQQGMSTGEKVAIGVGAAALLGCYEMGCFSHRAPTPQSQPMPQQQYQAVPQQ